MSQGIAGVFRRSVKIETGEGRLVGLMMLYSAAVTGGVYTVGYSAGQALFLTRLPASDTPYLFIFPAMIIVLALLVYRWTAARVRSDRVAAGSAAVLLCAALVFRLLLASPYGSDFGTLAALFLYIETAITLLFTQYWTLAAQVFDSRQARRLFGLIAAGGTITSIVAGLVMGGLVQRIGVENLLFIMAASLAICFLCPLAIARLPETCRLDVARTPSRTSLGDDLRMLRRIPLLVVIASLTILLALMVNVAIYQYFLALQATYGDHTQALAAFLGNFAFGTGVAALVVQISLTGRIMDRFGVFAALVFYPLALALGAASVLVTGGALWAVIVVYGCDPSLRRTIHDAGLNVLFLPVSAAQRQRAKRLMEALYAITFGLAGLVFLLMQRVPAWTYPRWSVPLLGLSAGSLGLLLLARPTYARTLIDSVRRRRFDLASATIDVTDETTVQLLARMLDEPDARKVLHILELIRHAPEVQWDPYVVPLLAHPSSEIREAALRHLGRAGNMVQADAVAALFAAPEQDVAAAAIAAYCAIAGVDATTRISPYLSASSPRVKGAAAGGLLMRGADEGYRRASAVLASMLRDDDPAMREAGAQVLSEVRPQPEDWEALLAPLLDDPHTDVRLAAMHAAAGLRSSVLAPRLLAKLAGRDVAAAATTLAAYGEPILPVLRDALAGGPVEHAIRVQAPQVLARIGTPRAADLLLAHLSDPDEQVRSAVCNALYQLRGRGVDLTGATAALRAAVFAEIRNYYALFVVRADLEIGEEQQLLGTALDESMGRVLDRAFWLLGALYRGRSLERVREILAVPGHGSRALAVELLDTVVGRTLGELLIPLVEAPADRVLDIARKRFAITSRSPGERLTELASGPDPWLHACALYRIGVTREHTLLHLVITGLQTEIALVRETALVACCHMLEAEHLTRILTSHADDTRFPSVGRYARAALGQRMLGST